MLLAVWDTRQDATSELLQRATELSGRPNVQRMHPHGLVGSWRGGPFAQGRDWIAEGRVDTNDSSASLLDRAAAATGDFAMVGFDADGLVAASGRAGGYRPLFVATPTPGRAIVSTSLDLVCKLLPAAPRLDPDVLTALVAEWTLYHFPLKTMLFPEVRLVPMCEAWHIAPNGRVTRRDSARPLERAERSSTDLAAYLRHALRAAVKQSVTPYRSVGVMVSGGLDSSAVLAFALEAARQVPDRLDVSALSWVHDYGEDRRYLRLLCQYLDIEPLEVTWKDGAAASLESTFVQDAMPFTASGAAQIWAIGAKARQRPVEAIVSGIGGDELDGRPELFGQLVTRGRTLEGVWRALKLRGHGVPGPRARLRQYIISPLSQALVPRAVRRGRLLRSFLERYHWAGPRMRRHLIAAADTALQPEPLAASDPAERFDRIVRSPRLLQACISRSQMERVLGCRREDPLYSEEFLRALCQIPPLDLCRGDILRGLFREAIAGMVPPELQWRRTKGPFAPALHEAAKKTGTFRQLERFVDVSMLADLGIVEPQPFRRDFERLFTDPWRGPWTTVWPVLATEAFLRARAQSAAQS